MGKTATEALGLKKKPEWVFTCSKHGDVSKATLNLVFDPVPGEEKPKGFVYCLHCLNEVLLNLQQEGVIGSVQVVSAPVETPQVPAASEDVADPK